MAVGSGFKQKCPSCEAMVPVKDAGMIGKEIECPKCKDRFKVVKPVVKKKVEEDSSDVPLVAQAKPKVPAGKKVPPSASAKDKTPPKKEAGSSSPKKEALAKEKPGKEAAPAAPEGTKKPSFFSRLFARSAKKTLAEADNKKGKAEESSGESQPQKKDKTAGKEKKDEKKEESSEGDAGKKKKKGLKLGSKKMAIGLGLAVVGLAALALAGFFILGDTPAPKPVTQNTFKPPTPPPVTKPPDNLNPEKKDDGKKTGDGKKIESGKKTGEEKKPDDGKNLENKPPEKEEEIETGPDTPVTSAGPEITNLLPPDSEQVVRLSLKNILMDANSPFREAAFGTPGAFIDADLKKKLGFSVLKIDEMLLAERFSTTSWSFTVVHVMENLSTKRLERVLGLQQVKTPIKSQIYYQVKPNPWLEQLGKLSPGVPPTLRHLLTPRQGRPLFVRLHNNQTLILADEQPMVAFLQAEGQFKFYVEKKDDPKKDPAGKVDQPRPEGLTYMTIKPALKKMLDSMQPPEEDKETRLLLALASEMGPALVATKTPEHKGFVLYRPRPLWDLTCMLEHRQHRLTWLSAGLTQKKDSNSFLYRSDLVCTQEADARDLQKELVEKTLPHLAKFAEVLMECKLEIPQKLAPPPKSTDPSTTPSPSPTPFPKPSESTSKVTLTQTGSTLAITMDLALDAVTISKATELMSLIAIDARDELTLAEFASARQQLAQAAYKLAKEGRSEIGVVGGQFPPAAFPRTSARDRTASDPRQRISWLAGLLPFLGHEKLYSKIQFDSSWRDPHNWLPGRTVVPQFLDPSYPDSSRFVAYPDLPVEMAATHYVGIAGVGLDAADYPPGNPAFSARRGILGYDQSASLEAVQKGRGLSNTVLMVQVPPDGLVGPTPWIAGGGSTVRGVPEKNSIGPFISPGNKDNRNGTYALMADGSVRFINKNISDEIFKTMCTYQGPTPPSFDLNKNENTPLVTNDPKIEKKTPPMSEPPKTKK